MKFIIPKNFDFKPKFLGIIDYKTAIFNLIFLIILNSIASLIFKNIFNKIIFLTILFLPVFLLSLIGFNNDPFLEVLIYISKYYLSKRFIILHIE